MKTETISESTRSGWKLTFDWANSVKAVTKASSSSVSAVFMDTLMMWIGFSLLFCRGWRQNQQLQGNGWQKPFHVYNSAHPEVVLLIQTGGLWIRSRLTERFREAGENFIKIPAKDKKENISRQQLCSYIFIRIKTRGKVIYHQVQSDLLKSSTHWKATMAPIRWQGGDNDPSRKSSLLCRRILNCPDPLTGTGTLETRQTHRLWQQRQKDRMTTEKTLNSPNIIKPSLDQVWPPYHPIIITYSPHFK